MSRTKVALVGVVAAGLMLMSAGAASADAPTVQTSVERQVLDLGNGWKINSPTTVKTTTGVSQQVQSKSSDKTESRPGPVATETRTVPDYKAQIQQPINPDGTSTWPAKRGVIPVQFKLTKADRTEQRTGTTTESRTVTTTESRTNTITTVTTAQTPSFQSVCGPDDTSWSVLGLYDNIPDGTTVKDITKLQADFNYVQGSSIGGSLRWDIGTDLGDIHIYYGDSDPGHAWTGTGGTGVNLMDATDDRFDDSNSSVGGGTFYNTKQQILDKFKDVGVNNASMVVDSCWTGVDQRVNVANATVGINGVDHVINNPLNERVESPTQRVSEGPWTVTGTSTSPWVAGSPVFGLWQTVSTSAGVQTNAIPAFIKVVKVAKDQTPIDTIEELSSAQGDTTGQFRQIDGKYMYNLKAETLGAGNFNVYMVIDNNVVQAPGVFELK